MLTPDPSAPPPAVAADPEWRIEPGLTDYPAALAAMEARAAAVADGMASELVWLVEHPPLYTAGTSADPVELLDPRFPVYPAGRGGRYTYHGPGQRVGYLMLNLAKRGRDVRRFVHGVEQWVIRALARLDVEAFAVPERIGIWTRDGGQEAKIGAIGVRVRRWVTFHGFSVNLSPDLSHFGGIVPCGLPEFPVTSLQALGRDCRTETFDSALLLEFPGLLASLTASGENPLEGRTGSD